MRVYISGKISGMDMIEASNMFNRAKDELLNKGHEPVNPIEISTLTGGMQWKDYMILDIYQLFDCDCIFMLKNWKDSKGARIERAIAKECGLKVFYDIKKL